ncbi:sensor histidine kinase [Poritiphilus flavus]|uniref:Sensor histidine kinase n=1 Tax=Poritiphilus flavus TaxID=2697053 RepID=A0A6L9EBJ7_9FLAO|nr:histidine kinase [Poritiphilus flavus]NAS11941.1 sensor histidine kinase [Poritiphilus flavus]
MKTSFQIREFWIHIIVWACLFSFPVAITLSEFGRFEPKLPLRILMNLSLVYINYLILVPRLLLKKKIFTYILYSVAVLVLINVSAQYMFPKPPIPFGRMPDMDLSEMGPVRFMPRAIMGATSLAFFLLGGVLGLTKDFYKRDRISKEKEAWRNETELQFLRAQLNPHFLFNSLNSIYSLVRNKDIEAPEAIITLAELMRYMLYDARQELVPLEKEIQYIKNFVSLQLLRLSNSEKVKLRITGDYNDKKISPLLLIPFVENAFKYGTDFKGVTDVDMQLEIQEDQFSFYVKNKIGVYRKDESNSGIGLENIKSRLQLLYPEEHRLEITKENGFYKVQLELNLS